MRTISRQLTTLALLFLMGCPGPEKKKPLTPEPKPTTTPTETTKKFEGPDLLGSSWGVAGATGAQSGPSPTKTLPPALPPSGKLLSQTDVDKLLARMKPLVEQSNDRTDFLLREKSTAPPRAGADVKVAFPATELASVVRPEEKGPLTVLRRAPEGDLALVPEVSVTFSQPMIAVSSVEDIAKMNVPVKITPELKGEWRWLGTKTVVFKPDGEKTTSGRVPMATDYTVEIPAGTKSALGNSLEKTVSFSFSTPPIKLLRQSPSEGSVTDLHPNFFMSFDQKINANDLLPFITVTAGKTKQEIVLLTEEEAVKDSSFTYMIKESQPGRWLAFTTKKELPKNTEIKVELASGAPSAEGPKKTTKKQGGAFRTYGPMKVTGIYCGYEQKSGCEPGTEIEVYFSNPLGEEFDQKTMLSVSPTLEARVDEIGYDNIYIQGKTKANTSYNVKLSGKIKDIYGQSLGSDASGTVKFSTQPKTLYLPDSTLAVLEPGGEKTYSVFTTNHKTLSYKLYAVAPKDWEAFQDYMSDYYDEEKKATPPGKLVANKSVSIAAKTDEVVETKIDLSPAFKDGLGHAILLVETPKNNKYYWEENSFFTWIQSTELGLDASSDREELFAFVSSLKDGKPLSDVDVKMMFEDDAILSKSTKTDKSGVASLSLKQDDPLMLIATKGNDSAFLLDAGWKKQERPATPIRWMVFDDRKMYRPGEKVTLKGWARAFEPTEKGDLKSAPMKKIKYSVVDSRSIKITEGELSLNEFGGFDLSFKLPGTPNLGNARVLFTASDLSRTEYSALDYYHYFQIQEFRRPEFEVAASTVGQGPFFMEQKVKVSATATYYTGGFLSDADTNWLTSTATINYEPPNQDDFSFGVISSRWFYYDRGASSKSSSKSFSGKTNTAGVHEVELDFKPTDPPQALRVRASATVMDVNRQAISDSATFVVHPASLYVGLKSDKYFVNKGEQFTVQTIVADLDGKRRSGVSYNVTAERFTWVQSGNEIEWKAVDPQSCAVKSTEAPAPCVFKTTEGGNYRISAELKDDLGRKNYTEIPMLVSGGDQPPSRTLKAGEIILIADQRDYKAGDTAKILVQPPFTPAEGTLTIRRNGIISSERISIAENGSYTAKLKIEEWQVPNVMVHVELVGAETRTNDKGEPQEKLAKKPAFATGEVSISVPPLSRTLTVKTSPAEPAVAPGAKTEINVAVTDSKGSPVAKSEVALIVVDESVLVLSNYQTPNPLSIFYTNVYSDSRDSRLREDIILNDPQKMSAATTYPDDNVRKKDKSGDVGFGYGRGGAMKEMMAAPMPDPKSPEKAKSNAKSISSESDNDGGEIQVRSNFDALALFAASVVTDANGKATVPFQIPDNLTRYRIMAVAVSGEKSFGSGESAITARLPLMARPSAPRFLNFGDKFELPVVLQNQTDKPLLTNVAVRATNTSLVNGMGYQVVVPANDRIEVRFPMATSKAGTARFQVGASAGSFSDAAELSLPIYTPATTEAFATYSTIEKGAIIQPVQAPDDVFSMFGGVEITTSSTAVAELTDAVLYLQRYPYECAEQISSRIISVVALKDVLSAFKAEGLPSPEEMLDSMKSDIKRLKSMQNYDGGFGFWKRDNQSWPYLSIHVAHALARAKEKGFDVPSDVISNSKYYLKNIESHYPAYYGKEIRATLSAYALYTRMRLGDVDVEKTKKLAKDYGLDKFPLEALGWLLPVFDQDKKASATEIESIRKILMSRVSETAGAANFTTSYSDGAYLILHSDRRTDGVLLEAMLTDDPKNELIPKLVRGLLNHRKAGHWYNTQENAFILLALGKYFEVYESVTPDFVAKAWLGDTYAGSAPFKGRSTERYQMQIPMSTLLTGTPKKELILATEGEGRLYYRIGMSYAPKNLKLAPVDYGFTVTRSYAGVDHDDDVSKDKDGVWHVKAGARVRVKIEMVAQSRRYHVALVDPIPAGLEAQNPALATTGPIPQDTSSTSTDRYWWWYRTWYEHQNLRDERVEAFASLLWDGVYNYSYVARATTPGVFVVPPTKAEEMYSPETFGRSSSDLVVVE